MDELQLRAGPCTDAKHVATLKKGDILIVFDGSFMPLKADGYPWYHVRKLQFPGPDGKLPPLPTSPVDSQTNSVGGWIAANDGSVPFVTPLEPRCPATVNLKNVRGMLPAERLACLDGSFVLKGTYGCGGCGGSGGPRPKPYWLAEEWEFDHFWVKWFVDHDPVALHFKPSGPGRPKEGSIIRVTVHVDDPASPRCTIVWGLNEPPFAVPDEIAIAYCRERIVVDSYEILGMDPDYFR